MNLSEVAWLKMEKSQVVQQLVHFLLKIKRSILCSEYNYCNKYTEYTCVSAQVPAKFFKRWYAFQGVINSQVTHSF